MFYPLHITVLLIIKGFCTKRNKLINTKENKMKNENDNIEEVIITVDTDRGKMDYVVINVLRLVTEHLHNRRIRMKS